jgi:hypothetical protein
MVCAATTITVHNSHQPVRASRKMLAAIKTARHTLRQASRDSARANANVALAVPSALCNNTPTPA